MKAARLKQSAHHTMPPTDNSRTCKPKLRNKKQTSGCGELGGGGMGRGGGGFRRAQAILRAMGIFTVLTLAGTAVWRQTPPTPGEYSGTATMRGNLAAPGEMEALNAPLSLGTDTYQGCKQ